MREAEGVVVSADQERRCAQVLFPQVRDAGRVVQFQVRAGAHRETGTPPHLRIRVDRLVWQVCDQQSWRAIGDAWFAAQRYLGE